MKAYVDVVGKAIESGQKKEEWIAEQTKSLQDYVSYYANSKLYDIAWDKI